MRGRPKATLVLTETASAFRPTTLKILCQPFGVDARCSLAAIFTKSARESAFIFRITLPRCAFTVISLPADRRRDPNIRGPMDPPRSPG